MAAALSDRPAGRGSPGSSGGERLLALALAVATAALVHIAVGYRPTPTYDENSYLTVFRQHADPSIYASDDMLRTMSLHALGWYWTFRVSQLTVGVERGLWIGSLLLAVATVVATFRIAESLGASRRVLPLVAVLAFTTPLHGVGRGAYDGAFGGGFHGQWLALCMLLWAYEAILRERPMRTGFFLGLAFLGHAPVAIHGAMLFTLAVAITSRPKVKDLFSIAAVAAAVASPGLAAVSSHMTTGTQTAAWPTARLIEDGYIFRLSHEYTMDLGYAGDLSALLLALAAIAGALVLEQTHRTRALAAALALVAGHVLLLAAALVCYGPLAKVSVLPYLLSLSRTSPLLVVLACALAFAGADRFVRTPARETPFYAVAGVSLILAILLCLRLLVIDWSPAILGLVLLSLVLAALSRRDASLRVPSAVVAPAFAAVAAVGFVIAARSDVVARVPPPDAGELFAWTRTSTPRDALFIIPPGFESFRWFSERSTYMDFKAFPPASIDTIATWRERMDDISAPDRYARALTGWRASREFDRCYATRNTPARIAELLERTGADYFVWDADGVRIPPLTETSRTPVANLEEAFRNRRFTVYRLRAPAAHA